MIFLAVAILALSPTAARAEPSDISAKSLQAINQVCGSTIGYQSQDQGECYARSVRTLLSPRTLQESVTHICAVYGGEKNFEECRSKFHQLFLQK